MVLERKVTKEVLGSVNLHDFDGLTLTEVVAAIAKKIDTYGRDSKVSIHWEYDELSITVYREIIESDEDYKKRVAKYKAQQRAKQPARLAKAAERKRKKEEKDRKLFIALRTKYNW